MRIALIDAGASVTLVDINENGLKKAKEKILANNEYSKKLKEIEILDITRSWSLAS